MTTVPRTHEQVASGLERHVENLVRPENGDPQWEFGLRNGRLHATTARLEDDWLMLRSPVAGRSRVAGGLRKNGPWSLLERNGTLSGGSRLLLDTTDDAIQLGLEVWLGQRGEIAAAVAAGCRGFTAGLGDLTHPGVAHPGDEGPVPSPESLEELRAAADEAGWQLEERSGGVLVHDLDVGRGLFQARVLLQPDGGVRAWTALFENQALDEERRRALGHVLARAGQRLRLVRATGLRSPEPGNDSDSVFFEVCLGAPVTAARLDLVLSSLAIACWTCGPEVQALTRPEVARRFMMSFGGAQMATPM